MPEPKRPLKVFLCHIIPLWDAHIIPLWDADRDSVRGLPEGTSLTTPPRWFGAREDGVDRYAWLDKEKPCGERSRTILPGQDWELEIRKAVRETLLDFGCIILV
mgnify:FL=1